MCLPAANSLVAVNPSAQEAELTIPLPGRPTDLAASNGNVWIPTVNSAALTGVNARRRAITQTVPLLGAPDAVAIGDGAIWVADGEHGVLSRITPGYETASRIRYPRARRGAAYAGRQRLPRSSVSVSAGAVWVTNGSRELIRVDPDRGRLQRVDVGVAVNEAAVAGDAVWALAARAAAVLRIDPLSNRVTDRIPIAGRPGRAAPFPVGIAAARDAVWVLNGNTATVTRIDPSTRGVVTTVELGVERVPNEIAAAGTTAWVANSDGTLSRIDVGASAARSVWVGESLEEVDRRIARLGDEPRARPATPWRFTVTRGGMVALGVMLAATLVACGGEEERPDLAPATPLEASGCSPVTYGGDGRPEVLIAAIMALQGPFFDHGVQNSQSFKLVLDERGWRAGEYNVGLQVCDETTATSQVSDPATCRRHARNFARNRSVVVVLGPVLSGCARELLPAINRATGGQLAVVVGCRGRRWDPERNFPSGRRNFVRVAAADDAQAAAAALFAKGDGAKRVFVLDDGDAFGQGLAGSFAEDVKRSGMTVVGTATWDAKASGYRPLAQRIRRSGADAVYLGGYISSNGPRLVKDLRTVLGPDVRLLAPDGFNQAGNLVEAAGEAAEDFVITIAVLPNDKLPPAGREFAAKFEARFAQRPCCFAVHAGQVAHMVLDAIEASDGSRGEILAHLFETRVENGLLGDFKIDPYGDTTLTTIGVYTIKEGRLKFEKPITPPRELLLRK